MKARAAKSKLSRTWRARVLGSGGPIDWKAMEDTHHIREAIAKIVPGFEKIAEVGHTEAGIPDRWPHAAPRRGFPRPTARPGCMSTTLPELLAVGDNTLRLMTVRSEGQFNTVVYEEYDLYRGQDRRDIILMHPDNAQRMGLRRTARDGAQRDRTAGQHPRATVGQDQSRQRLDVLSRGEHSRAAHARSAIEDAGLQRHPGPNRSATSCSARHMCRANGGTPATGDLATGTAS